MPLLYFLLHDAVISNLTSFSFLHLADLARTGNKVILKNEMDILTDKFCDYKQQDAHKFLGIFIDFLHDELENAKVAKGEDKFQLPTDEYFCLDMDVCLKCTSCNHSRKTEESFRNLTVEVGILQNQEGEEEQFSRASFNLRRYNIIV